MLCVCMLFIASCAYSEIMEFENFYVDVPEDWSVNENKNENSIEITADNKTGSLSIISGSTNGKSISQIANEYSQKMYGTQPEFDNDERYTFNFNNGISQAVITGDEDFYMLVIGTGIEANSEIMQGILESLEMK